jgi:hypothetical protein
MSLVCLDAFLDLVTPALVNLIGLVLLAALLTVVLAGLEIRSTGVYALLWLCAAIMGFAHLIAGLTIVRADLSIYRALAQIPRYALWKLTVYARMQGRWSRNIWKRTTRETRLTQAPENWSNAGNPSDR